MGIGIWSVPARQWKVISLSGSGRALRSSASGAARLGPAVRKPSGIPAATVSNRVALVSSSLPSPHDQAGLSLPRRISLHALPLPLELGGGVSANLDGDPAAWKTDPFFERSDSVFELATLAQR